MEHTSCLKSLNFLISSLFAVRIPSFRKYVVICCLHETEIFCLYQIQGLRVQNCNNIITCVNENMCANMMVNYIYQNSPLEKI